MNREEKSATIQEIVAQIEASEAIFAVDYRGISVSQAAELRSALREADASFRIVKNRLTKLAADKAGEERLAELLQGPTALTFVRGDTAQAAKAISTFNKEHEVLTYKGGFMGATALDSDGFKAIARLPTREVLIGQFAGVVASPITGVVRGLNALIQGLATQLGQIARRRTPRRTRSPPPRHPRMGRRAIPPLSQRIRVRLTRPSRRHRRRLPAATSRPPTRRRHRTTRSEERR